MQRPVKNRKTSKGTEKKQSEIEGKGKGKECTEETGGAAATGCCKEGQGDEDRTGLSRPSVN